MEILAGKIIKFYSKISVASVEVIDSLKVGDNIHIKGHTTDFDQKIETMEFEHQPIEKAIKGNIVGIKVNEFVRENDLVYRMEE